MPQLLFGKEGSFSVFVAGITDHSGRSSYEKIALVPISHKVHRSHYREHISELKRISGWIEPDIEFLSSFVAKVEKFFVGELIYQTTQFSFLTECH